MSSRFHPAVLLLLLLVLPAAPSLAGDAPPDSVYMQVESEGSVVGWESFRIQELPEDRLAYIGNSLIDGKIKIHWEMVMSRNLGRVYSASGRLENEDLNMEFSAVYTPDEEPKVELVFNGMRPPIPQKKLSGRALVIPLTLSSALAPLSERLRNKDPETLTLTLPMHNGVQNTDIEIRGAGYRDVPRRDGTTRARVFELKVAETMQSPAQDFELLQYEDGRFMGVTTETASSFVQWRDADSGPVAMAFDLAVPSPAGDLPAVLTLPEDAGEAPGFPVALLVSGPDHRDADGLCGGVALHAALAEDLAAEGVATLRYARRPDPESGALSMADLLADARAALDLLGDREDIDPRRIGLIGHGEAAMLLPELAGVSEGIRFVVSLGGVTSTGDAVHRLIARPVEAPWLESFLAYDPRPHWKDLTVPVMILHGELDREVPPEQASDLQSFLGSEGQARVVCTVAKKMNHLMQKAETGDPSEYATLEPRCAPTLVTRVAGFTKFCVR